MTPRSNREHRRYLCVCALTVAIAMLPLVLCVVFLYRSSELISLHDAAAIQQRTDALLGLAGYQNFFRYKTELYQVRHGTVVALGSSRMMPFREEFFRDRFINAGGAMNSLEEGLRFLRSLATPPTLLILGLDFWWFHPSWQDRRVEIAGDADTLSIARVRQPVVWIVDRRLSVRRFGEIIARGDRGNEFANFPNLGLLAVQTSSGFRKDGSYHYGNHYFGLYENVDARFAITLRRLAASDSIFPRGAEPDPRRLTALAEIVKWADERDVKLVLVLPPFAPPVAAELSRHATEFGFGEAMKRYVSDLVRPLGGKAEFYDFHGLPGAGSCEYVDGIHAGDVAAQRLLVSIVTRNPDSALRGVVDVALLNQTIVKFKGHALSVFQPSRYKAREMDFLQIGCSK